MDSITDSMDVSLSKLREIVKGREAWRTAVHGDLGTEQQPPPQVSYFTFLTISFFVYKMGIIVPTLLGYCENHTEHLTQCLVYIGNP